MKWFGAYWPSALTWHAAEQRTAVPVGRLCALGSCERPIADNDQGFIVWSPFHDEVFNTEFVTGKSALADIHRQTERTSLVFHRVCFERLLIMALRAELAAELAGEFSTGLSTE